MVLLAIALFGRTVAVFAHGEVMFTASVIKTHTYITIIFKRHKGMIRRFSLSLRRSEVRMKLASLSYIPAGWKGGLPQG